ncbi:ML5 [Symbiodinium pilosum]|uniref:ML5 protein n=1 Tax=Symbiodinium pilosum TaxID=2952 RepID=A0A812SIY3_SYMPI|nr:ML5 [Symbiodinium pilosum]
MLLELIDSMGFRGQYDFLYLPIDFQTHACLGYAFVNLVDPGVVPSFWRAFDGFSNWSLPSKKVCYISWSGPHQGKALLVAPPSPFDSSIHQCLLLTYQGWFTSHGQ